MTAVVGAPASRPGRSRPRHAPAGKPEAKPRLEVVDAGPRSAPSGRRRVRLLTWTGVVVVAAALLAVVASQAALAQGQFRLQRLQARAAAEQDRYERLRLQVAELESPSRVVAVAQERLGMVPPPDVTYLSPSGPSTAAAGRLTRRGDEAAAVEDWSTVKRQLATR